MNSEYEAPTSTRIRPVLASGQAAGGGTATGIARFVASINDLAAVQAGDVLLAEFTVPEWLPAMERVAAIVTNRGGRACHAAITARKLGVPAVVGTIDGASRLWNGAMLKVSCAEGAVGRVYEIESRVD
jgi:pyruvate,water dikinase